MKQEYITVMLSTEHSTNIWNHYIDMIDVDVDDMYLQFEQYLRTKFDHVTGYTWDNLTKLILFFDKEEHKSWFILKYSDHYKS